MCAGSGSAILSTGGKTVRRKGNSGGGAGIGLSLGRGSPPGNKLGGKAARGGKGSGKGGCASKIAGCIGVGLVASLPLHNVHFGKYVFLPTAQAETYLESCVSINHQHIFVSTCSVGRKT